MPIRSDGAGSNEAITTVVSGFVPLHQGDVDLARRAATRDQDALLVLLVRLRCVPKFASIVNRRFAPALAAAALEDATQDALATIWSKLHGYRGDASLETWAYRITELTMRNALRKARRQGTPLDPQRDEFLAAEDPAIAAIDRSEQIRSAMDRLPPEESDVVRLKQYEDRTFEQIGETLGVSPNTAKTRYYRALSSMRAYLLSTDPS
jgi:RNA polymerase sigma-70 factor, ECF subfamily